MSKKGDTFSHFGFSTILMIFIMLCLVTFAALSLLSANSDYRLSSKTAEKTTGYYKADTAARNYLYNMDLSLAALYKDTDGEAAYYKLLPAFIDNITTPDGIDKDSIQFDESLKALSFQVPISDFQILYVSVSMSYPTTPEDTFYKITCWQSKASLEPAEDDDRLHLLGN